MPDMPFENPWSPAPPRYSPVSEFLQDAAGDPGPWADLRSRAANRMPPSGYDPRLGGPALQSVLLGTAARMELYAAAAGAAVSAAAEDPGRGSHPAVRSVIQMLVGKRQRALADVLSGAVQPKPEERALQTTYSLMRTWSSFTAAVAHRGEKLAEQGVPAPARWKDTIENLLIGMHIDESEPWRPRMGSGGPSQEDMLAFAAAVGPAPRFVYDAEVPWPQIDTFINTALNDARVRWKHSADNVPAALKSSGFATIRAAETLIAAAPWVGYADEAESFADAAVCRLGPSVIAYERSPDAHGQAQLIRSMNGIGARAGVSLVKAAVAGRPEVLLPALAQVRHLRAVPVATLS